jgi:sensor histidine kinase YesM
MSIFQFSLIIFDSFLAVFFLLRFNGYKWNDKPEFFILFPALLLINRFLGHKNVLLIVIGSITVSYVTMIALKFKHKSKANLLWSCILYFGTLTLSNSVVSILFLLLLNKGIDTLMIPTEFILVICIISKSYLWGIIKIYIFLEEKNINSDSESIQPKLINSIYNIVFVVVILIALSKDILEERYGIILVIIGIVTSQIIYYYMYFNLNNKNCIKNVNYLLMQMNQHDQQFLEENKRQADRIARINHDIKNHLTYIAFNIENKNYEDAKSYIVELINNTDFNTNFVKLTDNSLNFIINHKLSQAHKKNIKIYAQIEDLKKPYIEEFDLCILLCNILDNAIEAVERQKEKKIHIEIYNYAGYQTYFIKNTIENSILGVNSNLNTTKNKKKDHGYGLRQINDIINKYHGHIDIYEMEKYFCIKILIPAS